MLVRKDLSSRQQLVQSVHAGIQSTNLFPSHEPWLVVCAVPNERALIDARIAIENAGIECALFYEPDDDLSYTALATGPITKKQRRFLRRYPLWAE